MTDLLLGVNLVLACQRTDCPNQATVDLGEMEPGYALANAHTFAEIIEEDWPEGWGWDSADKINRVLHCPEHRGA